MLVGSRVLDPDEAAAMRAAGMQAFSSLSLRLGWGGAAGAVSAVALTTLALGPGAGTAAGVGGAGGLVGLAVQSAYVARLGNGEGREGMAGLRSLLSGPVRVALPALLLLAGYKALQVRGGMFGGALGEGRRGRSREVMGITGRSGWESRGVLHCGRVQRD